MGAIFKFFWYFLGILAILEMMVEDNKLKLQYLKLIAWGPKGAISRGKMIDLGQFCCQY